MNEWLDMFGLESIWNDPDWPTASDYHKKEYKKEEPVVDTTGLYFYKKLNEK